MPNPDLTLVKNGELQVYQEALDHYVNLHCHNDYSIRDGLGKLDLYLDLATKRNLKWFSTTNHGTLADWAKLYKGCKDRGIVPVFGVEAYINRNRLKPKEEFADNLDPYRRNNHLTLLVKNLEGFFNLIKISNDAHLNGFYYKPRTDIDFIKAHSKGLIVLSGCGSGEIPRALGAGAIDRARELVREYMDIFEDFYIEVPIIDFPPYSSALANLLIQLAQEFNLRTVITGDVHYVLKEHADSHDMLILVRENQTITDKAEGKSSCYDARGLHYKTFSDVKELWQNQYRNDIFTAEVFSKSINTIFDLLNSVEDMKFDNNLKLPKLFADQDSDKVLLDKALKGKWKVPDFNDEYKARFKREYEIVTKMGFSDFFLLVSELNDWCRSQNILYGPGRGSVGGSLIAYLLNVTEIDPLKYGLLFERFLDTARHDPPDIDTDYDSEFRDKIIEYLKDKFGADHVLNIGIFQTNKTRSCILDVARVYGIPAQEVFKVTKSLEGHRGTLEIDQLPLDKIEAESVELRNFFNLHPELRQHVNLIRNMVRNVGQHACGVCIADRNLYDNIPIALAQKSLVTAWEEGTGTAGLKDFGYIKFDLLGLNNLSIIRRTIDLVNKPTHKMDYYDIFNFPEDDTAVLKSLNKSPVGIFQFESKIAQNAIRTIEVDDFNDICAINALLRPGPLRLGMDKVYGNRKHGRESFEIHPKLQPLLNETFGVIIYQEQIMKIVQAVGGFDAEESNKIRKLLSKYREWENFGDPKRMKEIAEWKEKFVGFATNVIGADEAERIYKEMAAFANYGFNKSHALGYAKIAYIDLYLRHYYPVEYFSALLSSQGKGKEIADYIPSVRKFDIQFKLPNINTSSVTFEPFSKDEISFSLSHLSSLTITDAQSIVANRPYTSLKDFFTKIAKVDKKIVNKSKMESLVFSGCFDEFGSRVSVFNELNRLRDKKWVDVMLTEEELDVKEVESLGFVFNSDLEVNFDKLRPWAEKKFPLTPLSTSPGKGMNSLNEKYFGYIASVQKKTSKAGKEMVLLTVKDNIDTMTFYVWKNNFSKIKTLGKKDAILFTLGSFADGGMTFLNSIDLHFKYDPLKKWWEIENTKKKHI